VSQYFKDFRNLDLRLYDSTLDGAKKKLQQQVAAGVESIVHKEQQPSFYQ